ncbi:hypothetical protein PILCRDRAFT_425712, partial [Piloderma croceum F 1598]
MVIEGCPVVHLHDSPDDFACLLKALYNPFYFAGSSVDERIPFNNVTAILRLSNKYDIQPFRQKSIQELKKVFPCTLHDYDAIYPLGTTITLTCHDIIQSILLARACTTLELLPCIYYLMSRFSMKTLLRCHTLLPRDEMEICLLGREKLQEIRETVALSFLLDPKPSQHCSNPTLCERRCLTTLNRTISNTLHLGIYALTTDPELAEILLCGPCAEEKLSAHRAARENLWNELPNYFGLGTWEELRSAQK